MRFDPNGYWIAALPESERAEQLLDNPELIAKWDARFGDRINQIVLIGIDLEPQAITAQLDACLLTDEELEREHEWSGYADALPNAEPQQVELRM
ncbi:GTP-binding protein [Paenibacillus athensensis]|uniref:CobW C-terminal domain-containing protein n=1 Tax=Paenibacillus athensensis TaxID=1967502 RepID=A0A4Y8Q9A1_9BACL|nr:GTP-binding protein [Paenibacillus athensensis]MCD1260369.1 GTP-binding protein [Paenibacillus athensensis]